MVLLYFGAGWRTYGERPVVLARPRMCWEFQAVLSGRIAQTRPGDPSATPKAWSLWLSGPRSPHGWTGPIGTRARVAVFHFRHIPHSLQQCIDESGSLRIDLNRAHRQQLEELVSRTNQYLARPSPGMLMCFDAVLNHLGLMVYEAARGPQGQSITPQGEIVRRALEYYDAWMAQAPTLECIAQAAGASPAHLRRLFHAHFGVSPKRIFDQLRERRILQLLADTRLPTTAIAEATGFSEASALSRHFRHRFGYPPSAIRQEPTPDKRAGLPQDSSFASWDKDTSSA